MAGLYQGLYLDESGYASHNLLLSLIYKKYYLFIYTLYISIAFSVCFMSTEVMVALLFIVLSQVLKHIQLLCSLEVIRCQRFSCMSKE